MTAGISMENTENGNPQDIQPAKVVGRPFQPGQSGNPNGRPKGRMFKAALLKALSDAGSDKDLLASVALALVAKAREGDVPAIREIADRLDGKVTQPISGDEDEAAILVRIERVIYDPKATE